MPGAPKSSCIRCNRARAFILCAWAVFAQIAQPKDVQYTEVRKLAWQKMASQTCWPFCLRFIGLWPRRFHVCFHRTGSLHLCPDVFVLFFAAVLVGRSCYGSGVAVSAFSIAMVRRSFEFHIFPANQRFEHPRVQSFALIIDRSYQFNHAGARLFS